MMQDMGSGEGGGETQAALEQFWPKVRFEKDCEIQEEER